MYLLIMSKDNFNETCFVLDNFQCFASIDSDEFGPFNSGRKSKGNLKMETDVEVFIDDSIFSIFFYETWKWNEWNVDIDRPIRAE